jgi:CDGSH-type Zn-finger protein
MTPNEQADSNNPTDGSVDIKVAADGPLAVEGSVRIVASDGSILQTTDRTWLCRCGQSSKKPFCDGSHRKVDFADSGLGPVK